MHTQFQTHQLLRLNHITSLLKGLFSSKTIGTDQSQSCSWSSQVSDKLIQYNASRIGSWQHQRDDQTHHIPSDRSSHDNLVEQHAPHPHFINSSDNIISPNNWWSPYPTYVHHDHQKMHHIKTWHFKYVQLPPDQLLLQSLVYSSIGKYNFPSKSQGHPFSNTNLALRDPPNWSLIEQKKGDGIHQNHSFHLMLLHWPHTKGRLVQTDPWYCSGKGPSCGFPLIICWGCCISFWCCGFRRSKLS